MMRRPSPFSPLRQAQDRLLPSHQRGFTLVEMVIVIVIAGIIGSMVAVFLQSPMLQYLDVARRADMTDIADTALRRIGRDLRLALPNSVRVSGTVSGAGACNGNETCFIEFLPTGSAGCAVGTICMGGGRYRAGPGGTGDELDFFVTDTSFEVLGTMPTLAAGDQIVVYNLRIPGADAYAGDNRTAYGATAGAVVTITAKLFPFDSPGHRFQIISTPVTYACTPVAGGAGGTLTRWQGYAIQADQPIALPAGSTSAVMANNVSACRFTYDANVVAQRSGLVTMNLAITENGETVTLYSATHVSNVP